MMADIVTFEIKGGDVVHEIQMPSSATILDIKLKIQEDLNVEVGRQTLRFQSIDLKDEDTISDYGFDSLTSVYLSIIPAPEKEFFINLKSRTRPTANIKVKESYKVADLKLKIKNLWGIEKKNISLFRAWEEMDDDDFLHSYRVHEGSEVFAEIRINHP